MNSTTLSTPTQPIPPLNPQALTAAGNPARTALACKERFRRLIAVHSAALGGAAGAGGQLRVTPELTRGLLHRVAVDAFNGKPKP
jgi:hypothetical protein